MKYPAQYYGDYLGLDKVLNAQEPVSKKYGELAHDEHLFIVIHQAYELWFKQILFEVDSVREFLSAPKLHDNKLNTIVARLDRVVEILKLLVDQIRIIETMTSIDFLDFRDYLVPASGFQSVQFRQLELALGLKHKDRLDVEKKFFNSRLRPQDLKVIEDEEKKPSLFELVEVWLERMPLAQNDQFDFWQDYQAAVKRMLERDVETIESNQTLNDLEKKIELENLKATKFSFNALFDNKLYNESLEKGERKLSQKATLSSLFIKIYRDEPALNIPFRFIQRLVDIDEGITMWRYRHAMMVQRILGTKIGTGGSSGHEYLRKTTENSRVFADFFNMASFLIPRSEIPTLPLELQKMMSFSYDSGE